MSTYAKIQQSKDELYRSYTTRPFYLPIKPESLPRLRRSDSPDTLEDATVSDSSSTDDVSSLESLPGSTSSSVSSVSERPSQANSPEPICKDELSKQSEFFWTYQEEPHRTRRMQILKAHPEVTKLCGHEPLTKYVITGVVALQFLTAYLLRNTPFFSLKFLLTAYVIGATANQNVFLCIHELSHNLGFKKPIHNRLFAIFANLPIGIPYSASFRPYHLIHHKHLGDSALDADLPTALEAIVLQNVAGKAFFATFQILFYAVRPMFVMKLPFTHIHLLNVIVQLVVDYVMVKTWGGKALVYFITSSFFAGSLHPCAGHFIAEHYVLNPAQAPLNSDIPPPETYSYYGILNLFTYNVGLHNEHHDFPFIPWTRLPLLTQIAREFYEPLPYHNSWIKVIWDFVLDDNVSLWCRVKRGVSSGPNQPITLAKNIDEAKTVRDDDNGDEDIEKSLLEKKTE
ncbi:fatty acid desaturase-domain-containing protein [Lipomyces tetrasporus]|uniref:sphingolipid 4-desaturase n=1 Tax=Lipomyces tetrasporus TaxID=54092 RepID=A0AAD7VPP7_9ASCO|nr:fatty acid desaturase-domain-containing protein [Lipomyces tetrasporus]KAJ8097403.1 fatty acid desaturase-domain-containing protein [Lipomyces tetrasporus]